jgi:hypothetical protein
MERISKLSRTPVAVPRGRRLRLLVAAMPLAALLVTACGPAQTGVASSGGPARQPAAPPPSPAADCNSVTTCSTPQQLQVAYGIKPLLDAGSTAAARPWCCPYSPNRG